MFDPIKDALYFIAQRSWGSNSMFGAFVQYLAQSLRFEFAFIGELVDDCIHTVAFYNGGQLAENITYPLLGSPCQNVVGHQLCIYPRHVQALFPTDKGLVKLGVESYAGYPLWDSHGKPLGVLVVMDSKPIQDQALVENLLQIFAMRAAHELERHRDEATLRASEEKYRRLVENMQAIICIVDRDGVFQFSNTYGATLLQSTPDLLLGKSYHQVFPPAIADEYLQRVRSVIDSGQPITLEEYLPHLPNPLWFHTQIIPLRQSDGSVYAAQIFAQDITAHKHNEAEILHLTQQLEARIRQRTAELEAEQRQTEIIVESVTDGIAFTDSEGRILYVNPAWQRMSGYTLAEVLGQNPRVLKSGSTPLKVYADLWNTIKHHKVWHGTLQNRRKDGSFYDVDMIITPIQYDGELHFIAVQRDVTETRQLALAKERFIADAAHDLNNPVNVLNTALYLLRHDPQQYERHYATLERTINRLTHLTKDLLLMSRLDRKIQTLELAPLQLNDLLQQVVDTQQAMAYEKNLTILCAFTPDLPPVQVDHHQIERVVVNLVSNALNYTLPGGTIWLKTYLHNHRVAFAVQDTGIGISAEHLPNIFNRFYRADNARKLSEGTGLGLPIVKQIVTLHGGEITVESTLNRGSTFQVILPTRIFDDAVDKW